MDLVSILIPSPFVMIQVIIHKFHPFSMCTNLRFITNPYLPAHHGKIAVKCGSCPACQQLAALKRTARIRLHSQIDGLFGLFVTLSYDNASLPYIKTDDIPFDVDFDTPVSVPVYRDCTTHYNSKTGDCVRVPGENIIDEVIIDNVSTYVDVDGNKHNIIRNNRSFKGCKRPVKFSKHAIGICYSPDFTAFIKRLKINLYRTLNISDYGLHSYYRVSEYGPTTLRPHFHTILFFKTELYKSLPALRRAIIKAWSFCHPDILDKEIDIARNPASYISAYVNRGSSFPSFLQARSLRPCSSHSRFFSLGHRFFSVKEIKESIRRRSFQYVDTIIGKDGVPVQCTFPYPQYVCHYYFPIFKGFTRLSLLQIRNYLCKHWEYSDIGYNLGWTFDEFLKFYSSLLRCRERLQCDIYQYADYYCSYVLLSSMALLKYQYSNIPNYEAYDNLHIAQNFYVDESYRPLYFNKSTDLNTRPYFIKNDKEYESRFYSNIKQRKQNDYVRSVQQLDYL